MTDRGKLEYRIVTKDEFSADLAKFQKDLQNSSTEFRNFKKELGKVGATSRAFAVSLRNLRNATQVTTTATGRRAAAVDRLSTALARNTAAEQANAAAITPAVAATRAAVQTERQRALTLQALRASIRAAAQATLAAAGANSAGAAASNRANSATKAQTSSTNALRSAVRNVFFSFRRLVGVLAIFTAAREVASGFTALVKESVRFNSALEQNQLGIAALIASVGDMRDSFGNTQNAQTRLSLAQGEARRQLGLLQAEAQKTAASFEDLAVAFQTGIGFGLEAGLDIDQVRRFTVQVSQAASAIGLEQNQLAEEIRSLLSGTINPRNTRIATVLNISNADVKRAREAGTLAEFLEERFKAFTEAGNLATLTFKGLATNTVDAFRRLISSANFEFFEQIKGALQDTLGSLEQINDQGFLEVRPEVLAAFSGLGASLAGIVADIRSAASTLPLEDIKAAIDLLGEVLATSSDIIIGAVEGILRAVSAVSSFVSLISSAVQSFADIAGFVEGITRGLSLGEIVGSFVEVATLLAVIEGLSLLVGLAIAKWPIVLVGVELAVVAEVIRRVSKNSKDANTELDKIALVGAALLSVFLKVANALNLAKQFRALSATLGAIGQQMRIHLLEPARQFDALVGKFTGQFTLEEFTQAFADSTIRIEEAKNKLAEFNKIVKDINTQDENFNADIDKALIRAVESGQGLAGVLRAVGEVLGINTKEVEKTKGEFEKVDGVLVRSVKRLAQQEAIVKSLQQGVLTAQKAFAAANQQNGIASSADAAKSLAISLDAQLKSQKISEGFFKERVKLEREILALNKGLALAEANNEILRKAGAQTLQGTNQAKAQINAKTQQLLGINQDILTIEGQISREAQLRQLALAAGSQASLTQLRSSQEVLDLEIRSQQIAATGDLTTARQVQGQANLLRLERERLLLLRQGEQRTQQLVELEQQLGAARNAAANAGDLDTVARLNGEIATVQRAVIANVLDRLTKEKGITEEVRKQLGLLKETETQIRNSLSASVDTLAVKFADSGAAYQATLQVLEQSVSSFASFASDAIVDALDPNTDTDLLERFANFLQQLAKMVIQTFIQLAIQKAILGAAEAATGGGGVSALARAEGGSIPSGRFGASPAHFAKGVQSFARGGRPAGIPASDTVPAWLTPGEFVMRTSAVGRYGSDIMAAINRGLIDPSALKAIAGSTKSVRARSLRIPAFAAGGAVAAVSTAAPAQSSGISRAVVVADERSFERMLAQGRRPMLELLRNEVPSIVANARGSGLL